MPRKKNNRDFIVAGYRRIAQDKKPSAIQLRALDRLAVICGLIKLREQDPVRQGGLREIAQPIPPPTPDIVDISAFMDFHSNGGGTDATTSDSSPSGQPDLQRDGESS